METEWSDPCEALIRRWLKARMTGCRFAQAMAAKASTRIEFHRIGAKLDDGLGPMINATLCSAAANKRAVVLVAPTLRTAHDVASLVQALCVDPRWRIAELEAKSERQAGLLLVALTWRTELGHESRVMGLVLPVRSS